MTIDDDWCFWSLDCLTGCWAQKLAEKPDQCEEGLRGVVGPFSELTFFGAELLLLLLLLLLLILIVRYLVIFVEHIWCAHVSTIRFGVTWNRTKTTRAKIFESFRNRTGNEDHDGRARAAKHHHESQLILRSLRWWEHKYSTCFKSIYVFEVPVDFLFNQETILVRSILEGKHTTFQLSRRNNCYVKGHYFLLRSCKTKDQVDKWYRSLQPIKIAVSFALRTA